MSTQTADVVVLVPGFLGFGRVGEFYYFAERVISVIRGALEMRLGRPVPVVPCCTLPMGRLAHRQEFLLRWLTSLDAQFDGARRIHLVGHSAGGVDAELLTCAEAISNDGGSWGDAARVRGKIASVTAIASPFHGTYLATSEVARFVRSPKQNLRSAVSVARMLLILADLVVRTPGSVDIARGMLSSKPETAKFLFQLWQNRDLIDDLSPASMARLRQSCRSEGRVPVTCFVTTTLATEQASRDADAFFLELRRFTAEHGAAEATSSMKASLALLTKHADAAIRCPDVDVPSFDLGASDGVVNSACQILDPASPGGLGGICVADHADVLGHYDRKDELIPGPPLNAGLFHSGSRFGDDQFFELYKRVASAIARAIEPREPAAAHVGAEGSQRFQLPPSSA
ncbi:esterase/lipase family protein [Sorangium sp. So ce131]|uniref:esterase/lipase family protein n=1 Tax=Sorangium sp. So ce131 TaxID=3133282 RepID=UPI003F5E38B0